MASEEPNPGGFISISSSEDEAPPPKKKRTLQVDDASLTNPADDSLTNRSKRARVSSSAGSISDAKGSEEGEINENEGELDDAEGRTSVEGGGEKNSEGVFLPQDPPLYDNDSVTFQLPVFSQKREGSWFTRFKGWVQVFYSSNSQHAALLTPALVSAAYTRYIDSHSGLKQSKKRGAKQAAAKLDETGALASFLRNLQSSGEFQQHGDVAIRPDSQSNPPAESAEAGQESGSGGKNSSDQPVATLGSVYVVDGVKQENPNTQDPAASSQSNGPDGPTMAHKEGVPTGDDALAQQRRYFPSASDPTNMCLLCSREGHIATGCTRSLCSFCGKDDHWSFACSTIPTRCGKCKQLGHASKGCVEKLALTKDEGLSCLYCKARDHLENQCTQAWRSFQPEAGLIKTVVSLPPPAPFVEMNSTTRLTANNVHLNLSLVTRRGH
ncbi:Protein AIR2-like protein [Cladobotryum mycophilum]|uniref:Protein AIR2-like protein n=1 Tax=Cladobotryum mycophilum TaxID=491253 RepID=A0ABR0S4Z4_9HYPO